MKILIFIDSDPQKEQRTLNMANLMANYGEVTVLGLETSGTLSIEKYRNITFQSIRIDNNHHKKHWNSSSIVKKFKSTIYRTKAKLRSRSNIFRDFSDHRSEKSRAIRNAIGNSKYDIVLIHHIWNIPAVFSAMKGTNSKFLCNLHEYYPEQHAENKTWVDAERKYMNYLCKKYLPKFEVCFSVCDSITARYRETFGGKFILFRNVKNYFELAPTLNDGDPIHLVHHGIANRSRKIENFIAATELMKGRARLHLYLTRSPADHEYHKYLETMANESPYTEFHPPVPTDEIPVHLNRYDVALSIVPNANFNQFCMLPNKMFESMQARLMLLVGPSPEMEAIVEQYEVGMSVPEVSATSIADKLSTLDARSIADFKQKSHVAARELSTEAEIQRTISELRDFGINPV